MALLRRPTLQTALRLVGAAALVFLAMFGFDSPRLTRGDLMTATSNAGGTSLGSGQSKNWSGYVATGGSFTSVAGTWTVPALTAGGTLATAATWVGIGGVSSGDLIQAGTEETETRAGRVRYSAWIEVLPQASRPVGLTVNPGDLVSVSVVEQATGSWQVQFVDNTTNQSVEKTTTYTSSLSSAESIEEAPSMGRRLLPLAKFGSVQFTNGSTVKNGAQNTISQAGATMVTMVSARGQIEATPSALGTDGASFSITRSASTTNAPVATRSGLNYVPRGWSDGWRGAFGLGGATPAFGS